MKFNEMDARMRVYEQSLDAALSPDGFLIARLDGNGFTSLTGELFEKPFDARFHSIMLETVKALMTCGFRILYGYTQSNEISLLFHPEERRFARKTRKYVSLLAGNASAAFSLRLGRPAVFDCRISPLPDLETVQDYFLWRQEDARRNALNAHCYWLLRKQGVCAAEAAKTLAGRDIDFKRELLLSGGTDYDALPAWQSRGAGVYWQFSEKTGFNPVSGQQETSLRRELTVDTELPERTVYAEFIAALLRE